MKNAVQHLNPRQTPVVTFDQPQETGEDKVVVMFGGLHIKMAALKTLGNWMDGSGWVQALVQAEIITRGTADSYVQPMSPTQGELTKSLRPHSISCSTMPMTGTVREKLQRQMISSSLKTGATREEKTSLSSSNGQSCWN